MTDDQHSALSYLRDHNLRSSQRLEETQRAIKALDAVNGSDALVPEDRAVRIAIDECRAIARYERLSSLAISELLADYGYTETE